MGFPKIEPPKPKDTPAALPELPDKTHSEYPDGTPKETAEPIKDLDKPNPISPDTTPELVPKHREIFPPIDEKLAHTHFVIDTFHNMTSVNTDRAAQVIADLKGYAEGSPVKVTYYKQQFAESDTKGIQNDADVRQHQVHKSMLKIHGFEIRMLGSLNYEHDTADNTNHLSGEALTYPGFEPAKGDRFIMEIETGKWGEMAIREIPTRMAIKSSTYYKIQFNLVNWMSPERERILNDAVWTEAYFDKQRFLNEQGALLYHAEYVDMKFMELHATQMVKYYVTKFLDKILMFTYMRPDKVYDPYVTDFMLKITDYDEAGQVAAQLFKDAPSMENSIWRALLSETVPLAAVPTSSIVSIRSLGSKTVLANSLLNKKYVAWEPNSISLMEFLEQENGEDPGHDPCEDVTVEDLGDPDKDKIIGDLLLHIHPHYHECILTCQGECSACCGDVVADDSNAALYYILEGDVEYKKMIRTFLNTRRIDMTVLRDCIKNVYRLEPIEQFYKMPIYIFLARTAVRYIHKISGVFE